MKRLSATLWRTRRLPPGSAWDVIAAGRNLATQVRHGDSALVVRGAGIPAVIATSFARSFYRNGVNNGLLLLGADTSSIEEETRSPSRWRRSSWRGT